MNITLETFIFATVNTLLFCFLFIYVDILDALEFRFKFKEAIKFAFRHIVVEEWVVLPFFFLGLQLFIVEIGYNIHQIIGVILEIVLKLITYMFVMIYLIFFIGFLQRRKNTKKYF